MPDTLIPLAIAVLFLVGLVALFFIYRLVNKSLAQSKSTSRQESKIAELTAQFSAVRETAEILASSGKGNAALRSVVELLVDRFGCYHAAIYQPDASQVDVLVLQETVGALGEQLKAGGHHLIAGGLSIPGTAAGTRKVCVTQDTEKDPAYQAEELLSKTRSEAAIPICAGRQLLGVLDLHASAANAFDPEGLAALEVIAGQIALHLAGDFRLPEPGVKAEETGLEKPGLFGQAISAETDLRKLYGIIHDQIAQEMGNVDFLIALYHPEENKVEIPYIYAGAETLAMEPYELGEGLTSYLIRTGKPLLLVRDTEEKARALGTRVLGKPAKSWLGVPLVVAGQTIGALVVQDVEHEGRFDQDDLDWLVALAPQVAIAIRNAQLLTDMRKALTALEEERFFLDALLQNTPDRFYFTNREGRFTRVSQSFAAQYGFNDAQEIAGKTVFDLMDEPSAGQIYQEEQEVITSGRPGEAKFAQDVHGNWTLVSDLPLKDAAGNVTGLLGIARDLTELKSAQDTSLRRAEQLRTAAEIAREVSSTLDLDELLKRVVKLVQERFAFYHTAIFLLNSTGENALLREASSEQGQLMKAASHQLRVGSQSIVGQVTQHGEALLVNDVSQSPIYLPNPFLPETQAELTIPIKTGERMLGALDIQSQQVGAFSAEDLSILQIVADQLAAAIVNANLFSIAEQNLVRHRLLHQITAAAALSSSPDEAVENAVEGLHTAMGGDKIAILLLDPRDNLLHVRAAAGYAIQDYAKYTISIGEGITGLAAQQRQPIYVVDTLNDPRYLRADADVRSEMAFPILYRDELLGVLNLESDRPGTYGQSDQDMLETLVGSLAAILANAGLIEQIRRQADRQKLLYNATARNPPFCRRPDHLADLGE